jgi:hypothetical protein
MRIVTACLILHFASQSCLAEEPHKLSKHFVMIYGTTEPQGISRTFPAVAIKADGNSTILATASWGGELFPVPPAGLKVHRFHVLDSDQDVELLCCDEARGVALFRIASPVPLWPADQTETTPLTAGEKLDWLKLPNREYHTTTPNQSTVKAANTKLPYTTPQGKLVTVNDTITFDGKVGGPPGTFMLKDGKLAAVWLNNDVSDDFIHHAITASAFMSGTERCLAQLSATQDAGN